MDVLLHSEQSKYFMNEAFLLAERALNIETSVKKREVPVGCVFILNEKIIAKSHNTVNETGNATRHAELNCIDQIVTYCQSNQLNWLQIFPQIIIYVTVEPCIMCLSILIKLKVKHIIFGCQNDRFGGKTVFDVTTVLSENCTNIIGGLEKDKAMILLKRFYKGDNPNVPESKRKKRN